MTTHPIRPILIGITTDLVEGTGGRLKSDCGLAYAECVTRAGGVPVLLPAIPELAAAHAGVCDAFVLTGGDDPRTEAFGEPTHPAAKPVHDRRQAYEASLLSELSQRHPRKPVLGVCLGMQMMSLLAGGRLDQHLPDSLPTAGDHRGSHRIVPVSSCSSVLRLAAGEAHSSHHQAVTDPGSMTVLARSHDGVIEGVVDASRPFYLGVQWHPERTADHALGQSIFDQLLAAARSGLSSR